MELNIDKGVIFGVAGAITVFIVILLFMNFYNSDFDHRLINQVDNGVSTDKLISEIDLEDRNMRLDSQERFQSHVLNKPSTEDYNKYTEEYNNEIKMISMYTDARIKFAKRETSKDQFLSDIKTPKEYMELINS